VHVAANPASTSRQDAKIVNPGMIRYLDEGSIVERCLVRQPHILPVAFKAEIRQLPLRQESHSGRPMLLWI
jgi:hypothetical protein